METVMRDVRVALRALLKSPGFTVVSLVTLAVGIGASVATFSVVNAILLRSLPYPNADRLVMIWEKTTREDLPASYLNYLDWKEQNEAFESIAAVRHDSFNLTNEGEPERLESMTVSSDFLSTLGVTMAEGRDFQPDDDGPGAEAVVILNNEFWKRKFGGDRSIIGKQLALNKRSFTVVGVTPAGFKFGEGGDIVVPLGLMADRFKVRGEDPGVSVVGRLKPGVGLDRARIEMESIMSRLAQLYPEALAGRRIAVENLRDYTVGDISQMLLMLMAAVGFVLLIACTNVANLLLARAAGRRKEVAIRTALGARRGRVIRQFLTESVLLSLAGGAVGLLLAQLVTQLLTAFNPGNIPRMNEISIDARVIVFTLVVSLLAGLLYGIYPAIQSSTPDLNAALKEADRGSSEARNYLRSALVVVEVSMALVLLIGSALMIRSFWNLQNVNPGFDAHNLLTMQMSLSPARDEGGKVARFLDQLQQGLQSLPGVTEVAFSNGLPFSGANQVPLVIEGVDNPGENPIGVMYITSADYFQVMKIRVLKGRAFSAEDTKDRPRVIIIDEVLAQKYFANRDPIGRRLGLAIQSSGPSPTYEIVGVVQHVKNYGLDGRSPVQPQFYFNFNQVPDQRLPAMVRRLNLVVRTPIEPLSLTTPVRREIMSLDKDQPIFNITTMETLISETIAGQRFSMVLLSVFGFVALTLAAVGIYGVMAYSVSQRSREIGIRMALGARAADVFKMIIRQGMLLTLIGLGAGLAGALTLTRVISALLFEVSATDPVIFVGISVLLVVVALAANFMPARRATRVDPLIALRYE